MLGSPTQDLWYGNVKILEYPDLQKLVSYDKGKAEYYVGELSRAKPYVLNTGVPIRPPVTHHTVTSVNWKPMQMQVMPLHVQ